MHYTLLKLLYVYLYASVSIASITQCSLPLQIPQICRYILQC